MITSAACRAKINGEEIIIPCHRHCNFFEIMKLLHCNYDKESVEQGFLAYDDTLREEWFLNRTEAYKHAMKCGQIPQSDHITELFSEDLY